MLCRSRSRRKSSMILKDSQVVFILKYKISSDLLQYLFSLKFSFSLYAYHPKQVARSDSYKLFFFVFLFTSSDIEYMRKFLIKMEGEENSVFLDNQKHTFFLFSEVSCNRPQIKYQM